MRPLRVTLVGIAVAAAAVTLTACGDETAAPAVRTGPDSMVMSDGTYAIGPDIMPGRWAITAPEGTRQVPCEFFVKNADGTFTETGAAGGKGIRLSTGQTLSTFHCGTWMLMER